MAAATRRYRRRPLLRRRRRLQTRWRRRRGRRTRRRRAKRPYRRRNVVRRHTQRTQQLQLNDVQITSGAQNILHVGVRDIYKKASLVAERLSKEKHHNNITVSDVKNALKKIMPRKYDKSASAVSSKYH